MTTRLWIQSERSWVLALVQWRFSFLSLGRLSLAYTAVLTLPSCRLLICIWLFLHSYQPNLTELKKRSDVFFLRPNLSYFRCSLLLLSWFFLCLSWIWHFVAIWICCSCQPSLDTHTSSNFCTLQRRDFYLWCLNISRYSSALSVSSQWGACRIATIELYFPGNLLMYQLTHLFFGTRF